MTISVKDAGVWKDAEPHVKDAGVWKPLVEGHVKEGGVWKKFYPTVVFTTQMTTGSQLPPAYSGYFKNIFGAISPNITTIQNTEILGLYYDNGYTTVSYVILGFHPNASWVRFTTNGFTYNRADGTYGQVAASGSDPDRTYWSWPAIESPFLSNPLITFEA